jgi:hypothetical protein
MAKNYKKNIIAAEDEADEAGEGKHGSRKKGVLIIALAALLVLSGGFVIFKIFKKPLAQLPQLPQLIREAAQENNLMEGKSAIALALAEARKWQADAELSYVLSADASQLKGRSNNWQIIFVSPSIKDKGCLVKIADAKISETKEISYVGPAAEIPANIISQAEAVAQVKAMPGYANVKILGVDMIYGAAIKTWYWGVKTDKGTVTVIAGKNQ